MSTASGRDNSGDLPRPAELAIVKTKEIIAVLKVIAQDFIKLEAVEIVVPLYRELVEKTK